MGSRHSGKGRIGTRVALLGTVFAYALTFSLILVPSAEAARPAHKAPVHHTAPIHHVAAKELHRAEPTRHVASERGHATKHHVAPIAKAQLRRNVHSASMRRVVHGKYSKARYTTSSRYGGISCVPFARAASGIELKGNATNWWEAASGIYARGARPEQGSVLNFRSTGRMRLGHVAVVARVLNSREIEIDHANWAGPGATKGGVSRGIPVIDVSEHNDWTQVRVGLGRSGEFGSVYPTYGFIYDRPDRGLMVANTLAPAHGGIIPIGAGRAVEVADAPDHGRGSMNVLDAPNHALR